MLRAEGLEVWGTSRDVARVPTGEGWRPVALDLRERESLQAAVAQVRKEAGVPDVIVNNAGAGVFAAFARFPEEEIAGQLQLLLERPIELARAFWPEMLARGRGALVNVSSLAAEFPLPCMALYTAAKGGLSAFSRTLMLEARASGVQVVDLQPGDYRTHFDQALQKPPGGEAWEKRVLERYDALLKISPEAEQAARDLRKALMRGRSGTVATGSFSQATLAMLAQRVFGSRVTRRGLRHYFRLDS
jgi:short-subunit dehydrogenase